MSFFEKKILAKTVSWRVIATFITFSIAYFLTGELLIATEVGVFDAVIKMLLYYLHEKVWSNKK